MAQLESRVIRGTDTSPDTVRPMEFGDSTLDALTWLQVWYANQCDGDWEHEWGVEIGTLDNPGWSLRINLTGTSLHGRIMAKQVIERSEDDWIHAWASDLQFEAFGGPTNLGELIHTFRSWAEAEVVGDEM